MMHDYDRAIADFSEAIRLNPRSKDTYLARGDSYKDKHDHDRAIADYGEAIRLDPNDWHAYGSRALILHYDKKDYEGAIAHLNEALRIQPRDATYLSVRGTSYEQRGEIDKALADFRSALAIDPALTPATEGVQRIENRLAGKVDDRQACQEATDPDA